MKSPKKKTCRKTRRTSAGKITHLTSSEKNAETEFQALVETAPDAIISVDRDGRIVFANSQAEKMFGYSRAELLGKPVEMLLPERFRDQHARHRGVYISQPYVRPMGAGLDIRGRHKDGREIFLDIGLNPTRFSGELVTTAFIRDISTRKRAEELIQRNLERIRALREIEQAITSTLDLDALLHLLLEKLDLCLAFPFASIVTLLNRENHQLEPAACRGIDETDWKRHLSDPAHARGNQRTVFETRIPLKVLNVQTDPQTRHPDFMRKHGMVSFLGVPLIAKDEALGVLSIYAKQEHDFTDEEVEFISTLAGQAAVAIHNAQLYEEMSKLAAKLSTANRVKDEFLSVMSHELRTPLNVVMGYAGLLRDGVFGDTSPEQKDAVEKILRRANDQLAMVTNILHATVFETGDVRIESHEISLEDFFNQLKQAYQAHANGPLELKWDCPPDLPIIKTDSGKLKQIMRNLIDNAIKFTDKGSVTISARWSPRRPFAASPRRLGGRTEGRGDTGTRGNGWSYRWPIPALASQKSTSPSSSTSSTRWTARRPDSTVAWE